MVGGPPATCTFFNRPEAKNPMNRLSGDQNGKAAPSVLGICRGASVPIAQSHSAYVSRVLPTKTMCRPSGDLATCGTPPVPPPGGPPNCVFSGDAMVNV